MFRSIINFFRKIFGFNEVTAPKPAPYPPVSQPTPVPPTSEEPSQSNVEIGEIIAADENERQMCLSAIIGVRDILASPFFKEEVLAAKFTNTGGLTNEQIYEKYIKSKLVVNIAMFYGTYAQNHWYKTVGYDVETDDFVHANRFFVYEVIVLMSLIVHELAHALGFHHESSTEYSSVPYKMNEITERVAKKLGY